MNTPPESSALFSVGYETSNLPAILNASDADKLDIRHLRPPSKDLEEAIISKWQEEVSTKNLKMSVCSICSRAVRQVDSQLLHPSSIDLSILQNEHLPIHVPRPCSYAFELYSRAFLDPRGMESTTAIARIRCCGLCAGSLKDKKLPKFAIANWLYYGRDGIPEPVSTYFEKASVFERALFAKARANTICCRFNSREEQSSSSSNILANARKGVRGNVMVAPLNVIRVNKVLPPPTDVIRETLCAVFVGRVMPSRANIQRIRPILVNARRVKAIIEFLLKNNSHYSVDSDVHFSDANLAVLLPEGTEEGVPASALIDFVRPDDAMQAAMSDYTPRYDVADETIWTSDDILMENVGYTDGDDTPASYHSMTDTALRHCLQGKPFLSSRSGSSPVDDFKNPSIMSWLFPHLDPWGIGGFNIPNRMSKITMEEQVKHLLSIADSPFMQDPEFPFICYNIIRKMQVARSLRFAVPMKTHDSIISDLKTVDPQILIDLNGICKNDPKFKPQSDEQRKAYRVLHCLRLLMAHIPGSDGHKLMMRNQIRALIYRLGVPTLFITLNPSDVDNPIVRLLSGEDINLDCLEHGEPLSSWQRKLLAARNPAACATFFDLFVKKFIKIILGHGESEAGLYGNCKTYYGTVEAQGKGTLHCHMLIWLDGHVSPQTLRDNMGQSDTYRDAVLNWIDSVISTGFPISSHGDVPQADRTHRTRHSETGDPHPGTLMSPSMRMFNNSFWREYNEDVTRLLYKYNWHEHQATCWKYLSRGQEKTSANCRLRMDGITRPKTIVDPESGGILIRRLHPWIAAHTSLVTFLLRCNMEIKFIGSGDAAKAFIYYVTDYITKPSLPIHAGMAALMYAIKRINERSIGGSEPSSLSAVTTAVNSMMGRHEISHPQVLSYLVGGGDHYTSATFAILYWGQIMRYLRNRMTDEQQNLDHGMQIDGHGTEETVNLDFASGVPSYSNQQLDYCLRSSEILFDRMSLYDFVSYAAKRARKRDAADDEEGCFDSGLHPQQKTHRLFMRKTPVTPVILGPPFHNPASSDDFRELWCFEMLVLFKSWRSHGDLKGSLHSYAEAYDVHVSMLSEENKMIIKNINVLRECSDARTTSGESHSSIPTVINDELDVVDVYPTEVDFTEYLVVDKPANDVHSGIDGVSMLLGTETSDLLTMCLHGPQSDAMQVCGQPSVVTPADMVSIGGQMSAVSKCRKRKLQEVVDEHDIGPHKKRRSQTGAMPVIVAGSSMTSLCQTTHLSATHSVDAVVQDVIVEYNLSDNKEQLEAFNTVADHVRGKGECKQLLMLVSGVGGTGKSHVIKSITALFERMGRRDQLRIGAPTGIAASLIRGQTLHSLVNSTPSGKGFNKQRLVMNWKGVQYLIVDEVSMLGARFLSSFSSRMRQARGDNSYEASLPFGGVNVLFFGDMAQLKPPAQCSLYDNELIARLAARQSKDAEAISSLDGVFLWRQVDIVVNLVKNQRHADDAQYCEILHRLRTGSCNSAQDHPGMLTDLETIRSRTLSSLAYNPAVLSQFWDAPVIVGTKVIRDVVNDKMISYHSARLCNQVFEFHSRDSVASTQVPLTFRPTLWDLPSSITKDSLGTLRLFVGMKVMVTENIAFDLGIVNGCEGIIHDIKYEVQDAHKYIVVVYVKFEGMKFAFEGVPEDVMPIFPVTSYIAHAPLAARGLPKGAFHRRQVPLVPAYSYTDFKSQGRTLRRAIVDIASARGQGIYVMLSRVKTLEGLAILRWFPPNKINGSISQELRNELARLDRVRSHRQSHNADSPMM